VGAAGGVGGYYLNFALGHLRGMTQTYASGFFAFAAIAGVALVALKSVAPVWTRSWLGQGGVAHGAPSTTQTVEIPAEREYVSASEEPKPVGVG
jgi:NNP family nitrate/nitrite transporter-like MFS transporter